MSQETVVENLTKIHSSFPTAATWGYTWQTLKIAFKSMLSVKNITSALTVCLSSPMDLLAFYRNTDPLITATYVAGGLTVVHYITSEITKNYSQVDKAWSILPIVYAWHFTIHDYLINHSFHPRLLTASVLITVWGARLTYNFARKGGYYWSGQDYRYPYLREKLGPTLMAILNIVFIAPFQDYLLLLLATPLYITNLLTPGNGRTTSLSTLDWIAVGAHLSFLTIEVIADEQQYFFQTEKHALLKYLKTDQLEGDYKLGFLSQSGLFKYSRHPNFFAEQSMWWTIYLFSVSAVQESVGEKADIGSYVNWTIAGPIILSGLFQGSTWLTEKISTEKYPSYRAYCQRVSRFLPLPSSPSHQEKNTNKKE